MDRAELHKIKKPKLYVVDGNGYVYRAFFALPKLTNSKGMPSNAIYGFTNMIQKLLKEEKPDYIAVAFDAKEKTFRHESYQQYKIDRPQMAEDLQQQIPYIRRICEVLNLPIIEKPGFEADDVICTMMEICKREKIMGIVVTSDKDLFQLVEDDIYTLDPMKDYFVYDAEAVKEKWGVPPAQIVEVLSIMGDSIDNIPGVKGIGPKGALELIEKFGTVENLLNNIDKIDKKAHRQKIEESKQDLILSHQLVQLRKDVPLDLDIRTLKAGKPDVAKARQLFLDLEFYSILNEYLTKLPERGAQYGLVTDKTSFETALKQLQACDLISFCCEIDSTSPLLGEIIGISLSAETKKGFYIPIGHQNLLNDQLEREYVLEKLKPLFENPAIKKTAYNLKYQTLILRNSGIRLHGGIYDPMLMSYVLNPTRHAHKFEDIAKEYLQYQPQLIKELVGSGLKKIEAAKLDVRQLCDYCCENTDLTLEVTALLKDQLEKDGLLQFYEEMELPLLYVLAEVEWNGVKIDTVILENLSKEMSIQLDRLVEEIYELAGGEFNINSPKQIGDVLFNRLKIPTIKKTRKTKDFSTSVDVLEELAEVHELPRKILDYRQFTKLKSTYVDALPLMIHPKTGRVHTNYQQTVAATGRLSSTDPNLQNIPIRTEWGRQIRQAFIPEKDNWLVSADYSQIELRVMAHLSNDPLLIDSFLNNEDIHARTASEVFGVPMKDMTKEIRNRAKAINYGINYGQSPFGLAQLLGIDQKVAKDYIDRYFEKYSKVKEYLDQTIEFVQAHGYVITMFGRRRYIPDIRSRDRNVYLAAQRAAINTPLQGTAADIIKIAMIRLQKEFQQQAMKSLMIMQVHDELVFEVPEEEKDVAISLIRDKMENVCRLVVPLTVDLNIGKNWKETK